MVAQAQRRLGKWKREQLAHVGLAEHFGQEPVEAREIERGSEIMLDQSLALEVSEKWRRAMTMIFIEDGASRFSIAARAGRRGCAP